MKRRLVKNIFEKITNCKLYRNSLPIGTDLTHDLLGLSTSPVREIWDVGAHRGETTLTFAENFPTARIRSFEPIAENFYFLRHNCSHLKNQSSHNTALGDENKKTEIYLQGASVVHSLRDDLNKPFADDLKSEEIEVKTIDSVACEFKSTNIDLLKVDVEGYEIKVLEGASKSLAEKKINFIYLETGLDDRFNSLTAYIDFLQPTGYLPYAFYEQTPFWMDKQRLWYWNTLFVKEELL